MIAPRTALQQKLFDALLDASAEAGELARRFKLPVDLADLALQGLAAVGLVDAQESSRSRGVDGRRWFVLPGVQAAYARAAYPSWPADELAWGRECVLAGDSMEDIAEMAGRPLADVKAQLGSGNRLTDVERETLQLYAAGCTFDEIARARGIRCSDVPSNLITRLRKKKGMAIPYRADAHG